MAAGSFLNSASVKRIRRFMKLFLKFIQKRHNEANRGKGI